jgi:hypothetical protein
MKKSIHDNKPIVYRLIKRIAKPALQGRHYPLYAPIPSTDEIYDPESDSMRTIRYATGEPSIFKDEQSEKVKLGSIVFQNGKIVVERRNPNLIQFLELSNHNADNEDRVGNRTTLFRKEDQGKVAKLSVDSILIETQAVNAVLSMKWDKLAAYARVLGVNTDKSSDEVKHDMIVIAKNSPQKFLDGIDDPRTTRKQVVMDAMKYGIITVKGRSVKWTIGPENSAILHVPAGREPVEYLAEWTMTEREGEDVFKEMKKRLDKLLSVDKEDNKE